MKFQKMELISAGTDFDIIRSGYDAQDGKYSYSICSTEKPLQRGTSTKRHVSRVSAST